MDSIFTAKEITEKEENKTWKHFYDTLNMEKL
jgi:hypothetical protein